MSPSSLIGKVAPAFTLKNHDGTDYEFKPEGNAPTAIFFYPKSGSYGCTKEACQFRDALVENGAFKGSNLRVIGISSDSVENQDAFVKKQKLTYPVLSDPTGEFRNLYGVGKGILGLVDARVTYFIDPEGIVRDVVDATMNYAAHVSFVNKCLAKYTKEGKFWTIPDLRAIQTNERPSPYRSRALLLRRIAPRPEEFALIFKRIESALCRILD